MIIYLNQSGRFGHQLSMFVLLYIYAVKYNKPFYYPLFVKKYLAQLDDKKLHKHLILKKINLFYNIYLNGILFYLKYIVVNKATEHWKARFPFLDTSYSDRLVSKSILSAMYASEKEVLTNYLITDINAFLENRTFIINQIQFNNTLETQISTKFRQLRQNGFVLLGLHIRQSDFENFLNGKYFFDLKVYFDKLEQCIQLINSKYYVFICSDEKINIDSYTDKFTNLQYEQRSYIEDFILLKNTDYIIGTRSAFSMMACYFGENKIVQIMNEDANEATEFLDYETLIRRYYDFDNVNNRMMD